MNYIDILLLLPLVYGLLRGLMRGLIKELASLAALIIGIFLAYHYSEDVEIFLAKYIENGEPWLQILSYVLIFAGVAIILYILSSFITKMINFMALGLVNRILGAAFGVAKILLIMLLLIFLLKPYIADIREKNEAWKNSIVYSELEKYSHLPGELLTKFQRETEETDPEDITPEAP